MIVTGLDGPLWLPSSYVAVTMYVYVLLLLTEMSVKLGGTAGGAEKVVSGATRVGPDAR